VNRDAKLSSKTVDTSDVADAGVDPIVREAKKRFARCVEWEGTARTRFIDDIKFANGDSDNGYQWPNAIRQSRDTDSKPCLTMNVVKQHNLQISNQARKNKSSIKVIPTSGGASPQSASVFRDIIRHIELISDAQSSYTVARNFQIDGGIGYFRLMTDYVSPTTFDQEIYIGPVNDPLTVFLDPDIQKKNGSDAKFGFVFDDLPKEEFDEVYPEYKDLVGKQPLSLDASDGDWVSENHVRICEYFRKVYIDDTLVSFISQGTRKEILLSSLPANARDGVRNSPLAKVRPTRREQIEWYLIAGEQVIDKTLWLGKFIPLIRIVGEEIVIEGQMDRKGHTRSMKDAQRMLNFNASSQVEFVALQGKTPWIASAKAIEEYESMWNTANTVNHSVLIYNNIDDEGNELAAPARTQPPNASQAYQAGMDTAFQQMMMVSGQWQNSMGMQGNERTGKAVGLRQQQSETATFHFQDNYESALQFAGEQLIDLIPKVYDTARIIMIVGEDGSTSEVEINPAAKQALLVKQMEGMEAVRSVFNPKIGAYAVGPSVGPAYGSKREQTTEALSLILTQAPSLTPIVGDLLLSSMDFDKAQEAGQRLKRMVPQQALGQGPSAEVQQLAANVEALKKGLAQSLARQAKVELRLVGKDQARDIDVHEAETKRIAAMADFLPTDPQGLRQLINQLVQETLQTSLQPILQANENNLDIDSVPTGNRQPSGTAGTGVAEPLLPEGAKMAPDGNHYLPDPERPGKFLKVEQNG